MAKASQLYTLPPCTCTRALCTVGISAVPPVQGMLFVFLPWCKGYILDAPTDVAAKRQVAVACMVPWMIDRTLNWGYVRTGSGPTAYLCCTTYIIHVKTVYTAEKSVSCVCCMGDGRRPVPLLDLG